MTDDAIRRAHQALDAARLLNEKAFHADAVSRAYYAAFHAATALLGSIGVSAKTHDGVKSLVAQHFVRPGALSAESARILAHAEADRGDADYEPSAVFT